MSLSTKPDNMLSLELQQQVAQHCRPELWALEASLHQDNLHKSGEAQEEILAK